MRYRSRFAVLALGVVLVSVFLSASSSPAALRTVLIESFTNSG